MATSRPRTPSRSPDPRAENLPPPPIPPIPSSDQVPQRRPSFSFLRRSKSTERLESKRSNSGGKLTKKKTKELERQREAAAAVQPEPPKIPKLQYQPQIIHGFGGDTPDTLSTSPHSFSYSSGGQYKMGSKVPPNAMDVRPQVPVPPIPSNFVDPYAPSASMANRSRYSYASSAATSTMNTPRRVRRRKDPTPFNILVLGSANCGKTSFVEFLCASLAIPYLKQRHPGRDEVFTGPGPSRQHPSFIPHYLESETADKERIGLTIWDSEGLKKDLIDLQLREVTSFIDAKFEDTFREENKVVRTPGFRDTHIHCVLLILDPVRLDENLKAAKKARDAETNRGFANGASYIHEDSPVTLSSLDDNFDIQVVQMLQSKTTVIPIISKADTITTERMGLLKRTVWTNLKNAGLDPFELRNQDEDDESGDDSDQDIKPNTSRPRAINKKFDERDEDRLYDHLTTPEYSENDMTSHFDSGSSSSSSIANKRAARPGHGRSVSYSDNTQEAMPSVPLSIIAPETVVAHEPGLGRVGREFPWGFADPYNVEHCDFVRLKEAVFEEWRSELREASREVWYEKWRTSRLDAGRTGPSRKESSGKTISGGIGSEESGVGIAR